MAVKTDLQVRRAEARDKDFIVHANTAMARETEEIVLDPEVVTSGVQAALHDENKALYFVAEIGGQPAGQLMITHEWSDWRNGDIWWIQSVYVAPEFRRQGVFRALYEEVREAAKRADAAGLRLYVHSTNDGGKKTYVNLGMDDTGYVVMEEMFRH